MAAQIGSSLSSLIGALPLVRSAELLLNSVSDVKVLTLPSWWTVRHTLVVSGAIALLIIAAMVWIAQLHRQVEERSTQLAAEIRPGAGTVCRIELPREPSPLSTPEA